MIKVPVKLGIKGIYLTVMKMLYSKPNTNIFKNQEIKEDIKGLKGLIFSWIGKD